MLGLLFPDLRCPPRVQHSRLPRPWLRGCFLVSGGPPWGPAPRGCGVSHAFLPSPEWCAALPLPCPSSLGCCSVFVSSPLLVPASSACCAPNPLFGLVTLGLGPLQGLQCLGCCSLTSGALLGFSIRACHVPGCAAVSWSSMGSSSSRLRRIPCLSAHRRGVLLCPFLVLRPLVAAPCLIPLPSWCLPLRPEVPQTPFLAL